MAISAMHWISKDYFACSIYVLHMAGTLFAYSFRNCRARNEVLNFDDAEHSAET